MKKWVFFLLVTLKSFSSYAESPYWLIQQDRIRLGKRDLYEEQRKKLSVKEEKEFAQKKMPYQLITAEDLENPQYIRFMPLPDLASLAFYPPVRRESEPLLLTCLHFQIASLHEYLPSASFQSQRLFSSERPYLSYVIYDIEPGSESSFEAHLTQKVKQQQDKSPLTWSVWRVLLGGDTPKYLICTSFHSKEKLKEVELEKFFNENPVKDIVRDRKTGWMKIHPELSLLKK